MVRMAVAKMYIQLPGLSYLVLPTFILLVFLLTVQCVFIFFSSVPLRETTPVCFAGVCSIRKCVETIIDPCGHLGHAVEEKEKHECYCAQCLYLDLVLA